MATEAVKITYVEAAAPSTPAGSRVVVYAKADGLMYSKDDAGTETLMSSGASSGSVATDTIWDAAGDLAVGSGANTAAKLAIGATNGMALMRVSGAVAWALPPGTQVDYVEASGGDISITHTTEGTSDTLVTGTSQSYAAGDYMVEYFCPALATQATSGASVTVLLYDGATLLGWIGNIRTAAGAITRAPAFCKRKVTLTAATHQIIIKAITSSGTATASGATGGTGAYLPAYVRVTTA